MDTIHIADLKVPTSIGITEQERAIKQVLKVSVWMSKDTRKAAKEDSIEYTIDYEAVANTVKKLGEIERKTLERFVEDVAEMILKTFDTKEVSVSARKYVLSDTDGVAVTISRP